jgi:GDPmannose 4,6-dehydratase
VPTSFTQPVLTGEFTALGVTRMLEAIRHRRPDDPLLPGQQQRDVRQGPRGAAARETPFYPRSPYGVAKVYGHWITVNYRESYGIFACSGILFNHESPRAAWSSSPARSRTRGAHQARPGDRAAAGQPGGAKRDWGFAGDYVRAMWLMLQQDAPTIT